MSRFDKLQKDLEKELKKNAGVQNGPNASEYMKFLEKSLEKAQTFNPDSPTYINYASGEKPKPKKKDVVYDPSKLKKKGAATTTTTGGDADNRQKVKKAKNPNKVPK